MPEVIFTRDPEKFVKEKILAGSDKKFTVKEISDLQEKLLKKRLQKD